MGFEIGNNPKICEPKGTSITFSHLNPGNLTQTISSTGVTVLDRILITSAGNVGIGINNQNALLHVSGTTILNNKQL